MTALAETMARPRLFTRALRGSAWIMLGYGGSQALRLGANLILTRLLFPEAFGLMAIVTVFLVGLTMFSDVGIGPSISQSKRGDDPDFLNTAWTIQVVRGFALWLVACAIAWPVSWFYGDSALAYLLPVAGIALAIGGFDPTRIETAHRHLLVGRLTVLDLISQSIGIVTMVVLALILQSVSALVLGNLVGVAARLLLTHFFLPGVPNRFRWEPGAASELIGFGKWIFASTIFGFLSAQGDRAVLGKFLTLSMLGVYNIGYFLASFPILLGYAVTGRVLIPIYREKPAHAIGLELQETPANAVRPDRHDPEPCPDHGPCRVAAGRHSLRRPVHTVRGNRDRHRLHPDTADHRHVLRSGGTGGGRLRTAFSCCPLRAP